MIGDINLFLYNDEEYGLGAEISVMIADPNFRHQGCAKEAVNAIMHYGAINLGVKYFFCKIHKDNLSSLKLFERYLKYFISINYVSQNICSQTWIYPIQIR